MLNSQVTINNQEVTKALERLIAKGQNLAPVMTEIAELLQNTVEDAFDSETSPIDGTPWQPLSDITLLAKSKRGTNKGRMLYDQGTQQNSLSAESSRTSASVGVNAKAHGFPYPVVHQFGRKDGKIVARPFFPITPEGDLPRALEAEVLEIIEGYFELS